MPTSKREIALAAFVAQLTSGLGAGWNVQRNRDAPFSADKQISVDEEGAGVDNRSPQQDRYDVALDVVTYRKGLAPVALGPAISETHSAVVKAALSDATLGGVVTHLRQVGLSDPEVDQAPGHGGALMISVRFEMLFFTRAGDPAQ